MPDRRVLSFTVPRFHLPGTEPTQWLGEDGSWVSDPDKALRFTMFAKPKTSERGRIDMVAATFLGGVAQLERVRRDLDVARARIVQQISAQLWPAGRPAISSPADGEAQEALLQEAWESATGEWVEVFSANLAFLNQAEFLGHWSVLQHNAPVAWRDIGERADLDDEHLSALRQAWTRARAEDDQGNAPASA